MNLIFEIDRQRLLDGSTGAHIASLQFSYPDKYPVTISITRGNQPHPVTGNVYVTLKPASAPLSAPLALLTIPVNGSATATGILDTYIQELDDWLPAANKRAAQFEVLVVSTTGGTEVSVDVPAQVSRRYNSVDQPGVTVAEKSLATQAEAEAGTNNTKWMSPLRVAQAISHLAEFADTTDELSEGTTNLYFTEARAKAALADELAEIGSDITELGTALATKADLVSGKVPTSQLTTFTYGQPGIVPNSFGADAGKFLKGDGNWNLPTTSDVVGLDTALAGKQPSGSYATLVSGKVPADQLPSYVDDVLEFANFASLPQSGEQGKIYVTTTAPSKAYRWTGSAYFEISASEVTSVAGKTGAVTLGTSDIAGLADALAGKQPSGSYATLEGGGKVSASQLTQFTYGTPGIVPNSIGSDATKFLKGDGTWASPALALEDLTNFSSLSGSAYKPTTFSLEVTASSANSVSAASLRSQHFVITFKAARAIDFFLPNTITVMGEVLFAPQLGDLYTAEILESGPSFTGQWTAQFKYQSPSNTIHTVTRADSALEKSSLRFVFDGTTWVLDRTVYHQHSYTDLLNTPPDVATGFFARTGDAIDRGGYMGQAPYQVVLANDSRLTNARRTAWVTPPSSPTNIASGLEPGATSYDGSFLYTLVRMPGGQTMRWARIAMSTTW